MQTIENTREKDVTMIAPDDVEVDADDAQDEFAGEVPHSVSPALQSVRCGSCLAMTEGLGSTATWECMYSITQHRSDSPSHAYIQGPPFSAACF